VDLADLANNTVLHQVANTEVILVVHLSRVNMVLLPSRASMALHLHKEDLQDMVEAAHLQARDTHHSKAKAKAAMGILVSSRDTK